jgi:histidinol-phosphate aminotransferase
MLTRRSFVHSLGLGAAAYIGARGRENAIWSALETPLEALERGVICLSSNENPLGPGSAVLEAIKAAFGPAGATPGRYSGSSRDLIDALASRLGVKPENIVLGCGSTQILRSCTHLFTAKDKPLVGTIPTYEECAGYAEMMGHPVRPVALDANLKIDLDTFAAAANGAGLVFYCNPNNPTATYVGARATREFLARVNRESPDTTVLVDEAYYDYVTDPDHDTHIPIAVENPRVVVARTFSKAYGMAGLRMGYGIGQPAVIKELARYKMPYNVSVPGIAAAITSLGNQAHIDQERARNTEVRTFTIRAFEQMGYKATDSQANFIFVDLKRPAKAFRDAVAQSGVIVGRDFPPYEKTHCRISIGTMDEMQRAVDVFKKVLGAPAQTTSQK